MQLRLAHSNSGSRSSSNSLTNRLVLLPVLALTGLATIVGHAAAAALVTLDNAGLSRALHIGAQRVVAAPGQGKGAQGHT